MYSTTQLNEMCRLVRRNIITSTTMAESGHPTSSLSSVELMVGLFGSEEFRYDVENPKLISNDKLIFSKGHASPLFYALWSLSGGIDQSELSEYRQFGSRLEGHPTSRFPFTVVPTGSLGQGLSIGVGLALNAKYLDKIDYRTYVLIGDGELTEGSIWEAADSAAKYELDNLVAIVDVNRLDQVGETIHGWDIDLIGEKFESFGWDVILLHDGHNIELVKEAYNSAFEESGKPIVIIAKTVKGKGVSIFENKEGWHGKVLNEEQGKCALAEIGIANKDLNLVLPLPRQYEEANKDFDETVIATDYNQDELVEVRNAYGQGLLKIMDTDRSIVVLDAGVSNSTRTNVVKDNYSERFFEMNIAEQNMVGVALGLASVGKIPFVSTFGAFFTRAFDQIRMAQYSDFNITFGGSHVGVSIGKDGASQMGLEDISMFRSIRDSTILYPSDAVSMERSVCLASRHDGISYIRSTRSELPVLYKNDEKFEVGKSKVLYSSKDDELTIVAGGITLPEAIKAYQYYYEMDIRLRIIDIYSVKPLDLQTLLDAASDTKGIIVVEDHYLYGGIGEAIASKLSTVNTKIYKMAVSMNPMSGTKNELLDYSEINSESIIDFIRDTLDESN